MEFCLECRKQECEEDDSGEPGLEAVLGSSHRPPPQHIRVVLAAHAASTLNTDPQGA